MEQTWGKSEVDGEVNLGWGAARSWAELEAGGEEFGAPQGKGLWWGTAGVSHCFRGDNGANCVQRALGWRMPPTWQGISRAPRLLGQLLGKSSGISLASRGQSMAGRLDLGGGEGDCGHSTRKMEDEP